MPTHVVLLEPEIGWNAGNAGRSCLALGAQLHLVKPLGFRIDQREVRRAGLDYWPRVAPRLWDNWEALEAELPALGTPVFFSGEGASVLWEVPLPDPVVLIFGKESAGLPVHIRSRYQASLVRIPMVDPEIRSLNLSTTVALALYEVARRKPAGHP